MRRTKSEKPVLQLKVRGKRIRSGRIPVPELIRICQEAQNAVLRQAEALEGKKTMHPGPPSAEIRDSCTLELVAVKKGSTTLQFVHAETQLSLPETPEPAKEAVRELAAAISSIGNGNRKKIDPGVLLAIYNFSGIIDRNRISEIKWIAPKNGIKRRKAATVDGSTKERVAIKLSAPRSAIIHVDGILDMADFKPGDKKCRIDPAIGVPIACTFDPEMENEVYELLRKSVRIVGRAILRPYTERIESVHIEKIRPLHSLEVGKESFFADLSIDELAQAQDVKPLQNVGILSGGIPDEENVDDFLHEIYGTRE